jgi:hypothetical protein
MGAGAHTYPVVTGLQRNEAVALFRKFYARENTKGKAPEYLYLPNHLMCVPCAAMTSMRLECCQLVCTCVKHKSSSVLLCSARGAASYMVYCVVSVYAPFASAVAHVPVLYVLALLLLSRHCTPTAPQPKRRKK